MLRFKLGSIPVEVHPSHLLVSAFFGLSFVGNASRMEGWPPGRLVAMGELGTALSGLAVVAAWMAIVFFSVLAHEFGHALAAKAYGYPSVIRLVWLGGHTTPEVRGPLPWNRDVGITAAGPGASLLLTLVAGGAWWALKSQPPGPLFHFVSALFGANVLWTALNLLPVMPLDGGRLALQFGHRLLGRRGLLVSQVLALLVCGGVVFLGWKTQQTFLVAIFALFGFQTFGLIQAWMRGESPLGTEEPALEPELVGADAHLRAGRLEEATAEAGAALEAARSPRVASRAHLILGWAALKDANARRALGHFGQVQGLRVPPHALAASFSLLGDELRALPLWEAAWTETRDRTVLHEWAGALIRAGGLETAKRLPGVDLSLAHACAGRALFLRGAYSEAAALGEEALRLAPSPELAYEAACAHARGGNLDAALGLLHEASGLGFADRDYASSDEDLARLHGHPGFATWLEGLSSSAAS